jgi:hypothetical protein|tara:strand:- start:326 stop:511 length:186 start_codon:yes stop_codon:yes gene_type:complete
VTSEFTKCELKKNRGKSAFFQMFWNQNNIFQRRGGNKKSLLSIKNRDLDSGIYISGFKLII